ncbi:MAG: DUF3823 domain-containing protein [Bacteroidetes bacterium]|nr:DUF3823 domain-containing protein [Bacteroidota bacterium]
MKTFFYITGAFLLALSLAGCSKYDNYPAPDASLTGTIFDSVTGKPFQTEPNGMRIYALQTSYKLTTTPIPLYYNVMPDGSWNNTAVFSGSYKLYPTDGAFVPVVYSNSQGTAIDHGSQIVNVQGVTKVNFTVTPFLEVEWVGDPQINPDSSVTVTCKFTRGTQDPSRQFNVTDVFLFISETDYVSNGSYENKFSKDILYSGTAGNALLGQTVSITSLPGLGHRRNWYLRVGARTADNVNKRYNYTEVKTINIP